MGKPLINRLLPEGAPDWNVRRTMAFMTMLFCFGMSIYSAAFARSEAIAQTGLTNSFTLLGVIITMYVCAAVVDDKLKRDSTAAMPEQTKVEETKTVTTVSKVVPDPNLQVPAKDPDQNDLPLEEPPQAQKFGG